MIFNYDLSERFPTYDFFLWLTHVRLLGATQINFDLNLPSYKMDRRWPREETLKRFKNFIEPGPALANLPSLISSAGEKRAGSIWMPDIWAECQRQGRDIPRLVSLLPPRTDVKYTVTLRRSFWKGERNSDTTLWRAFAHKIGAYLVDEFDYYPISLHERFSLYAGARMNYGVPNGPLHICFLSEYPITEFCDPEVTARDYARHKMGVGSTYPWARWNQRHVWKKPTMDLLLAEHDRVENEVSLRDEERVRLV